MDIETIRNLVKRGDHTEAARLCNCSVIYVFQVLSGERNSQTELGQRILRALARIIEVRQELYREFGQHV